MATIRFMAIVTFVALVAAIIVVSLDPAFAQVQIQPTAVRPLPSRGVPGPIAGAGLVAVLASGVGFWLFRRFRKTS
jgi:hypothetical protein